MKRTTLVLAGLLLPAALLAQQGGMPPAAVRLDAATEETVREVISGVGTVEPWLRTVLSAETAGLVASYPLREGDAVRAKETVVCELDRKSLEIDLAEAEALLSRAKAEAATAVETARATMEERRALKERTERDFVRAQELFGKQVIGKAELDRAEADAVAAGFQFDRAQQDFALAQKGVDPASQALQAEVRRAEARLARVNDQLRKCRIVSPVDGRVVRRLTEVGGWVVPGGPVIEITTLDPVLVRFGVNEREIAPVRIGNAAEVKVDAWPGRPFPGKVRFLVPEADPRSRTFPVLIEVANPDGALEAGMFARVSLSVGEPRTALTVPKDAIVQGMTGTVVYTLGEKNDKGMPTAKAIPVTIGKAVNGRIEVAGPGLAAGLPVLVLGNEKVMPGQGVIPLGAGGPPGGPPGGGHPGGGPPGGGGGK